MSSNYVLPNGTIHGCAEMLSLLEEEILATHPMTEFHFDQSDYSWFFEAKYAGRTVVLEWSDGMYGVSDVSGMKGSEGYGNRPDISTPIYADAKRHLLVVLHVEIPKWILDTLKFYASNPKPELVSINGENRYVFVDKDFGDRARKCLDEIAKAIGI